MLEVTLMKIFSFVAVVWSRDVFRVLVIISCQTLNREQGLFGRGSSEWAWHGGGGGGWGKDSNIWHKVK